VLNDLRTDLKFALRTLRKSPAYTGLALVTLALGIGATTAIFSLVNGVLLRPLPYPEPDELVRIWERNDEGRAMNGAWPNVMDWRETAGSVEEIVAVADMGTATVLGIGEPVRVGVAAVSEGFFRALGVAPVRGRAFLPEEHRAGVAPVAVVSESFWRTYLGAEPDLSALALNVSGFDVTVVGVAPAGLDYPGDVDLWYPAELREPSPSRTAHNFIVLGRLGDGVTVERAKAELDAITATFAEDNPDAVQYSAYFPFSVRVTPLRDSLVGSSRRPLMILLGASALLLLVACTNLASASLARGTGREGEVAVRLALGAGRGRIARQLFTESLTLAVVGAAAGVGLAAAALRVLPALSARALPRMDAVRLDGTVLLFALVAAVVTAVVFGLLPAFRVTEGGSAATLRSGRGAPQRRRAWFALVAAEVALALVLLVGCGLLIRSFYTVLEVDPGFRTTGVLTATVNPPEMKYPDGAARRTFYKSLERELRALPDVAEVGFTARPPLAGIANGQIQVRGQDDVTADYHLVDTGYFAAFDIPLIRGRLFDERDREDTEHVVVVNRAFAEMVWPGEDPLGRQITAGGMDSYWNQEKWATVVGVVGDVRQRSLIEEARPGYYFSYRQRPSRSWSMTVAVRPERGRAVDLGPPVRDVVRRIDPDVPVSITTMESRVSTAVADRRFSMLVLVVFAVVALVLASVGIYGVVAYTVARRTREIGIRVALGADPVSVRRFVQRDALLGAAAGGVAGIGLALALTRIMQSLLYEVSPTDPVTFAAVVATLGAVAWLAAYMPSRRGSKVDPLQAIRAE